MVFIEKDYSVANEGVGAHSQSHVKDVGADEMREEGGGRERQRERQRERAGERKREREREREREKH